MTSSGGPPRFPEPAGGALEGRQKEAVRRELDRILAGAEFRGTRRSQEFLRYIVVQALEGRGDLLKERLIGIEVFERDADYHTGDDSIVRVNANEVRKRLAQYYRVAGPGVEVEIELPAGSYMPEFRFLSGAAEGAPPPSEDAAASAATQQAPVERGAREPRRVRKVAQIAIAGVLLVAAAAACWVVLAPKPDVLDQFWQPFERGARPVLLCVAHPVVYSLRRDLRTNTPPMIPAEALRRDPDHFVGVGDALTMAQLSGYLARKGRAIQLRIGTDTSFSDLRDSPAVLIGAFSNQWTMEITKDLRFTFEVENGRLFVKDQLAPGHRWEQADTSPPSDFAIISRVFASKTGEPVVIAAGLGHFGTQVAGEFLTNPVYLQEALRGAPAEWPARNIQFVLRAEVIGRGTSPPKTLATYFW